MCGIVGVLYKDSHRKCQEETITSMRDLQTHRGPDAKGVFIEGNVGLGHRRLSIIDLTGGHQPMTNARGKIWIVFNGEIYNFKEIRQQLSQKGYIFNNSSDTETILNLYEDKGVECVKYLNGMFAFAIWDTEKKVLFIARDRLGIKPLYYVNTNNAFMFSSEIKSFFASGHLQAECNYEAFVEYLVYRDVAGEKTLFKNVYKLLPGYSLIIDYNREPEFNRFWSIFPEDIDARAPSFDEAVHELKDLLEDSVKIRLMSDVPLGTFCSGGIDSSLITAIASKFTVNKLNTFSVGFYEREFDESYYANLVANDNNTDHHVIKINGIRFSKLLPKMIWYNDEPLNFANSIHMYALSKLSKDFVTVVLTGEGSDELFCGYPRYQIPRIITKYRKLIKRFNKLISLGGELTGDHRFQKLIKNINLNERELLLFNSRFVDNLDSLIKSNHRLNIEQRESFLKGDKHSDLVSKLSILEQQTYLVSILNRQDKMSMAASIESRIPFLDHRLVEYANNLPVDYKIKLLNGKIIIREMAKRKLPIEIIKRKKSGFGVPIKEWLKKGNELGEYVDQMAEDKHLTTLVDKKALTKMIEDHNRGRNDNSEILWALINYSLWYCTFISKNS